MAWRSAVAFKEFHTVHLKYQKKWSISVSLESLHSRYCRIWESVVASNTPMMSDVVEYDTVRRYDTLTKSDEMTIKHF